MAMAFVDSAELDLLGFTPYLIFNIYVAARFYIGKFPTCSFFPLSDEQQQKPSLPTTKPNTTFPPQSTRKPSAPPSLLT